MPIFFAHALMLMMSQIQPIPEAAEAVNYLPLATSCEWKLSGGTGERIPLENQAGKPGFRVQGNGQECNYWHCEAPLKAGQLYRLDFLYIWHGTQAGGAVIAGPESINHDFPCTTPDLLSEATFTFVTPQQLDHRLVRLGQWHVAGMIDIADPILTPLQPVHSHVNGTELGEGEQIKGNTYSFLSRLDAEKGNYSRPLRDYSAAFNTCRWMFGQGQYVQYEHSLAGIQQKSGKVEINVNHHVSPADFVLEAGKDGQTWQPIAKAAKIGTISAEIPQTFFPATAIHIRMRNIQGGTVQVDRYGYEAALDGPPRQAQGSTRMIEGIALDPTIIVWVNDLGTLKPTPDNAVTIFLANKGTTKRRCFAGLQTRDYQSADKGAMGRQKALNIYRERILQELAEGIAPKGTPEEAVAEPATDLAPVDLEPDQAVQVRLPLGLGGGRDRVSRIRVVSDSGKEIYLGQWWSQVPILYVADYGESLPCSSAGVKLWWCDAPRKISRQRPAPANTGDTMRLSAAKNECEAAQLVIRPERPISGLMVTASDLRHDHEGVIPKGNISLSKVYYHPIEIPKDHLGVVDDWPDALPPLTGPMELAANTNQPLWILVHVPEDAPAGNYQGTLTLKAEDWKVIVPLKLNVWNFSLPKTPYTQSAFGMSWGNVFRYQGLKSETDQRAVFAKYMQCFADHRISPYNPVPFDPIDIKFRPDTQPPRADVDFTRFDKAMTRAIDQWHITSFQLPIPGMGSGTFESRHSGEIGGHKAGTPEYEAMFQSMVSQLEKHLREKNWLNKAYIYWFDEPEPKDYDFVREGMERIHKYAPGLCRMLTEEPGDTLSWSVDLWCPLTPHYRSDLAGHQRVKGQRFWWYICCGPAAPYCTLFIDHPATDLRVWPWQTWERMIEGILVWETAYWTSGTAFLHGLQNPYLDPMSYVSGYSTPPGTKAYWGNGDGRFLYPPLAAAGGSDKPIVEGPVSSIRWEMLRDGIEDVDYLHILLQRVRSAYSRACDQDTLKEAERLLHAFPEITAGITQYTYDPVPIERHRAKVAEMIEKLADTPAGK